MKLKYLFLLSLLCLCCVPITAQNRPVDSLNILIKQAKEDTNKVNHLRMLVRELYNLEKFDQCIAKCKEGILLGEKLNYKKGIGRLCNMLGCCYNDKGNYAEALKILLKGLKVNLEVNDKRATSLNYLFLGHCFTYQSKFDDALKYYTLSLKEAQENNCKPDILRAYTSQAEVYRLSGQVPKALNMYLESLSMIEGDSLNYAGHCTNIANTYETLKNYPEALKYCLLAQKYTERKKDTRVEAYILSTLSQLYLRMGDFKKAETARVNSILKAKETGNREIVKYGYSELYYLDSLNANYKAAFEHHKLFVSYRDSITNIESQKSIIEQVAKHDYEEKENLAKLEQAKKEVLLKSEKQKQQVILFSVIAGLLLVIVFSVFLYKRFRTAQLQKSIIEKQKHLIEEHQKETIDSITYAKRIQDAILPPIDLITAKLPNSFVLFKPKDIVAGDFYWMEEINDCILIAAADCTGHGVPGAMVSVVCSNALNRAVKEFKLADTGAILDKVTDLVLETFEKSSTEVKDGMDISLLSINKTSKQIQWSGANNPLWYFENAELKEIKADKQPIGKSDHRKSFTAHLIEYKADTTFYLFTDGFADQFGGPKGKKFKHKQFQETLSTGLNKNLLEQQNLLNTGFENWKGILEQIDDVCVIGIRI